MDPFAHSVVPILIEDEMRSSYMDYSMSVIIGRALPDVRDGLKPVHRRILYAMHGMGMQASKKYSKCAGVVGEVLKKFHPHGDSAVYDAAVRMAQPWNLRYLLVDGQGNFGSVDGDPPAAYRYTECRMTRLAEELLTDIDEETVDFSPNFDGTTSEPDVLPCSFPNLLVNGAEGIAVGMATKIPPHNLGEVIDGCVALIEDPDLPDDELYSYIPGPDFPTAGTIYGRAGIREAYTTGRGRVVVRGRAEIETLDNGRNAIVIDELPYQVNKARLVESIAELAKDRKIEGIATIREESDRHGMRVVVELKRDAVGEVILNQLYKHTALQSTFGVILLAIVNQRPRILTLREMLQHYIAHRREVVLRRSRFRLRKARERAHILEGFLKALDLIDAIIATIRASGTVGEARDALVSRFQFSELQAQAILEMRLQRLTGMERQRIEEEHAEVISLIAELEAILGSEARLMEVVRDELAQLRAQYADPRRTRIVDAAGELSMHDLVAEEDQVVTLSHLGYIKRCRPDEWKTQRRGGMGKRGMATRQEDFVTSIFVANTHSMLLVFTDQGTVFPLMVYDVPEAARDAKGRAIVNLVPVPEGERVSAVVSLKNLDDTSLSLLFVSRQGLVKRTSIAEFRNLRQGGMRACGVAEGDALVLVRVVDSAEYHVILFSRGGKCIRFGLDEVPEYGRPARGNLGMQLADGDEVVDVVLAPADALPLDDAEDDEDDAPLEEEIEEVGELTGSTLLTVTELGFGSRTDFHAYRPQRRNGKGILSFKIGDATGSVVGAIEVWPDDQLMLVTDTGRVIRFAAASVPVRRSRAVKGVRLMRLEPGERIVDLDRLEEPEEADDGPAEEPTEK
ncbi:MAG TPA: DNA gyrase subunit A [Myxococcota bacterium]|nr:DNA gyrase subunit A [Myxococcota bacterium]